MAQPRPVRVLAVSSGKGGVGKTNVAVNLGVSLSELGRHAVLLDADLGLANVDVLLGLQPKFNLSHVLSGERSLDEILVEGPSGLKIVPASSGIQRMSELTTAEQAAVIRAFGEMNQDIDVLLVDTAAGISGGVVNFARACQDIILVVCDEPTSLTDAYAFIKLLNRDYGVHRFQILPNMVQDYQQGQALFGKLCRVTDRYLDVTLDLLGVVPRDEQLRKAVQKQTPVVVAYPHSKAARAFRALALKMDALPISGQASGRLEFFVERMIQYHSAAAL
ncbi:MULTISPECIES: MinD/ParA family protein [Methylocaldum]|uniref:MinD/ParA family protein n=1 Tax=unclassified Methylocaldum TaxID=2622260 RepID=UPI00098A54D0|nr:MULTISPECIES: MinD/ParA family protein [unclassified Methylocaldum]MBP1149598.1 flagellar biosynthesis protein FlhG [Methylocaldum sp. RMAD-M]MVF20896.1 MinD/ParA family protein [Methylocaldum sp. BRCS4]